MPNNQPLTPPAGSPSIRRLAIIGVGLIGGSLAQALRSKNAVSEVVGCGRQLDNLQRAVELGVIDHFHHDPAKAARDADIVLLAVPVGSMQAVFKAIQPALSDTAIVTDVGSVKGCVLRDAAALGVAQPRFVPAHPIAGAENSGVSASNRQLFEGRRVILTPAADTETTAIEAITAMWQTAGAVVDTMTASQHDQVLAATSHLPHLLAYQLVNTLAGLESCDDIFAYAAGGFRDFTRIASSDPVMWRDITLTNRDALLTMLDRYSDDLSVLRQQVAEADGEQLQTLFANAKAQRDRFTM